VPLVIDFSGIGLAEMPTGHNSSAFGRSPQPDHGGEACGDSTSPCNLVR